MLVLSVNPPHTHTLLLIGPYMIINVYPQRPCLDITYQGCGRRQVCYPPGLLSSDINNGGLLRALQLSLGRRETAPVQILTSRPRRTRPDAWACRGASLPLWCARGKHEATLNGSFVRSWRSLLVPAGRVPGLLPGAACCCSADIKAEIT